MAAPQASSRLEMLQARFQQRQLLEKEQKLLQLYDQQQLRAQQVAQRGSAGSNGSNSSGHGTNNYSSQNRTVTKTSTQSSSNTQGGGKVRQMFDERRQTTVKGIDKSYPLEPLENRRKQQISTNSSLKNVGNPMSNRQTVMTKRTVRSEAKSNVNGGKPIVSYHEEISRESCGPTNRAIESEEFGDDDDRYDNGNSQIDPRNQISIEDATNDNINQRDRTTGKIHLAGFDSSNETYRTDDDLENERFPEDRMIDVPDRLPPRRTPVAKKSSQSDARLERFKNSNKKKIGGKTNKQVIGNTTSFTKKRTETTSTHSGSSSRGSTVTRTMEEETSRASSTSPDFIRTGRSTSSSPEVIERERKLTQPIVDRTSSVIKNSCISKVSQMSHQNLINLYPRRKSEFEKSKTFRKLQLELGETSPEPVEPDEEIVSCANEQYRKTSFTTDQNVYTFDRRSSSTSPIADRNNTKERKNNREKIPEFSKSRRGSKSPIYRRKSSKINDDSMMTIRKTSLSNRATDIQKERRSSREIFIERPQSRRESVSPLDGRKSSLNRQRNETISDDTNIYSTRRRSYGSSIADRDASKDRQISHESSSPERATASRTSSESPIYREKLSSVTIEETRMTRKRSPSPRKDFPSRSIDHEESIATNDSLIRSSEGTLRSVELVKKLVQPKNSEKSTTSPRRSSERRTTLEEINLLKRKNSRKRSESPIHRIVKKDKAMIEPSKENVYARDTSRKNSREIVERIVRSESRTISSSPSPTRRTIKETESFRGKKTEKKNSAETKIELKKINETKKMNLSNEKLNKSEKISDQSNQSHDEEKKNSRRTSSETSVRLHDTYKVNKPSKRTTIEIESFVDNDEQSREKEIKSETGNLLERIEKIRSTISRSDKSEQNLQSKDFERTDSVESALRRFDSIGVETEHRITVGVDEIDSYPINSITMLSDKTSKNDEMKGKKSANCRSKLEMISVADIVKVQPRNIDANEKARISSKEKIINVTKMITPRKDKNKKTSYRSNQKIVRSLAKKSNFHGEKEASGRGDEKSFDRSPLCKRRLFNDNDDNSKPITVSSKIIKVTKSSEAPIESTSCIESKNQFEKSTKILRSIEDIRKSIKRESQDFKRELNKFNIAMKRDDEKSKSLSDTISSVMIKKTMKNDNESSPIFEIVKSTVKLPITHRVGKSPSPDIGTKRKTDERARSRTASIRRSVPSSPAKSPDETARYGSAESKSQGVKNFSRPSTSPSSIIEDKNRWDNSRIIENEYSDTIDNPENDIQSNVITESVTLTTRKNDEFPVVLDDDEQISDIKDNSLAKSTLRRRSSQRSLTRQQSPRPTSSLSTTSSAGSNRVQASNNNRIKMSTKTTTTNATKGTSGNSRGSNAAPANDGLSPCKICGRRFNSDRITLHEQICTKTATKKRKQFDATSHRVKGTELEPFVKKGALKKPQAERKGQKPEVKSNWRRKHEDFINAIRSAKQVKAHLAAGGKLSDLPPPPASDTSDYVQCPHCGRKFNQGAAERHIPKCQNMLHNKPNPRAAPKPKR